MKCNYCGAPIKNNICDYCGAVVEKEKSAPTTKNEQQGNWPVIVFIDDEYIDDETGVKKVDYFAFDVVTDCETDVITGKDACIADLKKQIEEYIKEEPLSAPTEDEVKNNKYSKKLMKNFKYEIVYLVI